MATADPVLRIPVARLLKIPVRVQAGFGQSAVTQGNGFAGARYLILGFHRPVAAAGVITIREAGAGLSDNFLFEFGNKIQIRRQVGDKMLNPAMGITSGLRVRDTVVAAGGGRACRVIVTYGFKPIVARMIKLVPE